MGFTDRPLGKIANMHISLIFTIVFLGAACNALKCFRAGTLNECDEGQDVCEFSKILALTTQACVTKADAMKEEGFVMNGCTDTSKTTYSCWCNMEGCNENMDKVMEAAESGAEYAGPGFILGFSLTMAVYKISSI